MRPSLVSASRAVVTRSRPGIIGEEGFRAVVGPFHRPADALRRPQDRGLLGIEIVAQPEAAADVGADEADLLQRQAEAFRQHHARRVDALVAGNERVGIRRRVVGGDAGARLHLAVGDALVDEGLLDHEIGCVERRPHRRGIAELLIERDVVRARRGQIGSAPSPRARRSTAGSTSYSTSTASAASRAANSAFRHHHRDRFARIAHAVGHQRILRLFEHRPLLRREGADLDVDRAGRIGPLQSRP